MRFPILALVLAAAFGTCAQALEKAEPAEVGLSEARLAELTTYLQNEVRAQRLAGAEAMILRHGRIAYHETVGGKELGAPDAMPKDTLFRIASMTKPLTCAGVLMLIEEGWIDLNDSVAKYLPEFAAMKVLGEDESVGGPTIHQLLTHTSGIGYGWFGPEPQDAAYREAGLSDILVPVKESLAERTARLATMPLAFRPGTQWSYGLSTDVLGRVIEVVSGLTLAQFFEERLFRPLGMRDTFFYVPNERQGALAPLYTVDAGKKLLRVDAEIREAGPIRFSADFCLESRGGYLSGGSGLVSTARDYARFLQAMLDGGAPILEPESVAAMTRNQIGELTVPFPGHGDGFGYGVGVLTERGMADDVASVGTWSWGGIFNTYFWVDPQEELVGILMTQVFPHDHLEVRSEFKRLAYEAIDDSGFSRLHWYEPGVEQGNPFFNNRQLRVNAPEAGVHENFAQRSETRSSGLARILITEDLRRIRRADLYCEIWGGHPGTANKRVTVNGRRSFGLPDAGTAAKHCTHSYPRFSLRPKDLVNGYNALQFACDQGETFWGHYIIDNAALRIGLTPADAGMTNFRAKVTATPDPASETIALALDCAGPSTIARVHYFGRFTGYDENGNGRATDWHGMTKNREPYGHLGSADEPPFAARWDVSMLPAQSDVAVKALVRFKDRPKLVFETPVTGGLAIAERGPQRVSIHGVAPDSLPAPFWSRAGRKKTCAIELALGGRRIDAADLHVVTWTGGAGDVEDYFTLNGHHLPVAEGHGHKVHYARLPVDPAWLREGANEIVLHSDTSHHGIEILLPGPALVIRSSPQ